MDAGGGHEQQTENHLAAKIRPRREGTAMGRVLGRLGTGERLHGEEAADQGRRKEGTDAEVKILAEGTGPVGTGAG